MIPVDKIDPQAAETLINYLSREIQTALSERKPLEDKWSLWLQMYRGTPEFEVKEFPYLGAANLVIPVIATDIDIVFSRLVGLLFSPSNLWTLRPLRPDMIEFAARMQEFLEVVQERELNAYDATADFLLDICKLGTGVLKQRYRREQKTVYEFRETPYGVSEQFRRIMIHDHPQMDHVSLFDFLLPPMAATIQSSPWAAERILLDWGQYIGRVQEGIYTGNDRIKSWMATSKGSNILQNLMRLERYEPGLGNKLEVWECWLDFDIAGVADPVAVVATIHIPSMTYLRIDYNPFFNQDKPYSSARFMRQEKRFLGIGLAEMLEHFQDEITAMHNQRIDSGTLANSTMFKGRKGVISQDEPIYPGRWFLLDNMEDVQALTLGTPGKYDSSIQYETSSLGYASRRSGVNDYLSGTATPSIGYAALGTNLQQLEQTTQRFDQVLREVRRALSESGMRLVELYQQFDSGGKEFIYMGQEDGIMVNKFLQFPLELARMGIGVDVTATSAAMNKDVDIRKNTLIMQMLTQFYQQVFQAMTLMLNPQLPEPLRQVLSMMVNGGTILMRRILDAYGTQDVDELVPKLQEVLNGQSASLQAATGQQGGPGGFNAAPGMEALGAGGGGAGDLMSQFSGLN